MKQNHSKFKCKIIVQKAKLSAFILENRQQRMRNKNVLNYKERLEQLDHIDQSDDMFQMQPKVKKNCCQNCCKKFVKFMISRVGLLIVMVAYLAAGGIIFEQLESQNENKALKLNEKVLEDLLRRIYKQIEINSTRVKDASFHGFLDNEIKYFFKFINLYNNRYSFSKLFQQI